jgi:hypothetical protein
MRGVVRRIAFGAAWFSMLWLAAGVLSVARAKEGPPALHVDPPSGASGQTITLTGERFAPGATYQLLICPPADVATSPCGYSGANLVGLAQFTAARDGTVPAGTIGAIPDLLAGPFAIEAIGSPAVAASTPFTVTQPAITVSPGSGASGTSLDVNGSAFAPEATYTVCFVPVAAVGCGGTAIELGDRTADSVGAIDAGLPMYAPGAAPGAYAVGVYLKGSNNTFIASQAITITAPSFALSLGQAPGGTSLITQGSGFADRATYTICLVPAGATECGGVGVDLGTFVAAPDGSIPAGTTATLPTVAQGTLGGPGTYAIGVLLQSSTAVLLTSVPFTITSGAPQATMSAPPQPTVSASSTPVGTASGSDGAGGLLWLLVLLLLIVVIAVLVWWRRRGR